MMWKFLFYWWKSSASSFAISVLAEVRGRKKEGIQV
jgi:hypothetical protein